MTWNGGEYMIGLGKIAPHETVEIDVKKLRDEQKPDERGKAIPLNISGGQIKWTIRSEQYENDSDLRKTDLIGRSEQIDEVNGISSSYACLNCCQKTSSGIIYTNDSTSDIEAGDQIQFQAFEYGFDCYGNPYYFNYPNNQVTWSSSNNSIATISNLGLATAAGAGDVTISGRWSQNVTNTYGGYCPLSPQKSEDKSAVEEIKETEVILSPDCSICRTTSVTLGSDVNINVKPGVQKIQYQEPNTTNFVDITNTLYILKGTTVTFKAIPNPANATFATGQPTWSGTSGASGTGQSISVTFNTTSSSATDYKTVIANSGGMPVTVNVIVYELTGTLIPEDDFTGRSQVKYGVSEVVILNFTTLPSLTVSQTGNLMWKIVSGSGTFANTTTDGTNVYRSPVAPSTEVLKIEIVDGPSKGLGSSYTRTVVAPTGTSTKLGTAPNIAHLNGTCSVTIKMDVYLLPKDVSFEQIVFIEDMSPGAIGIGTGFYAFLNGARHDPSSFWDVGPGNINDGCFAFPDRAGNDPGTGYPPVGNPPQCTTGDFKWVIPWYYQVTVSTPPVHFTTATHHQYTVPPDETWIEKAGTGPIVRRISDPTTYFP